MIAHSAPLAENLPTGFVALLFTDVAGSTEGWERYQDQYGAAIARHFEILQVAIEANEGCIFKTVGDQVCAVFASCEDAVRSAMLCQRMLRDEPWPPPVGPVRVRMAIHAGDPVVREADYFGPPVNRVARLLNATHPGQILVSTSVRDHLPSAMVESGTKSLGVHMLKDLQNPEAIFQVLAPDLPTDFPPPRTLDARPHNLPVQLTSFIGRSAEIDELAERLADPSVRLVTLMGPPGVGKTRLATQFAAEFAYRYPDGVWLVELAPVRDPASVAHQIETALGLGRDDGRHATDRLFDALAQRRLLLVCDNFEHVLPAADVVSGLLRATKNLQVLVTSRSLLRIGGETVMEVDPLAAPRTAATLHAGDLGECPATSLFVDRATAARPSWQPSDTEAAEIAELCRELDGLPLAIELAAARMRSMTVRDIRARLSDRFRLLSVGSVDLPERQRTLRAALDWSFGLLRPEEQETLAQLGVFRGGFTLEAAEAVCPAGDVWDTVPALHDHSFLIARERNGVMRYDMLEVVREYACERLGAGADARRAAHAAYFLPLAEDAAADMDTVHDAKATARVEADADNIRAAMSWACSSGQAEVCARFTVAMAEFFNRRGWWVERLQRVDGALSLARAHLDDQPVTAWLLYHQSNALADMGRMEEANASAQECLRRARSAGDAKLEAWTLNLLGFLAERDRQTAAAEDFYRQTVETARRHNDAFSLASALTNRARLADTSGRTDEAVGYLELSLPIWRQVGSARGLATTLTNLGCIADEVRGQAAEADGRKGEAHRCRLEAIRLFGEALGLQLQLNNQPKIALLLNNIGEALERDGLPEEAVPLYVAAERLFGQAGSSKAAYVREQRARALGALPLDRAAGLLHSAEAKDPLDIARDAAELPRNGSAPA